MRQVIRRAWYAIRRHREDELREEMAFHRDMKQRELEACGLAPVVPSRLLAASSAAAHLRPIDPVTCGYLPHSRESFTTCAWRCASCGAPVWSRGRAAGNGRGGRRVGVGLSATDAVRAEPADAR